MLRFVSVTLALALAGAGAHAAPEAPDPVTARQQRRARVAAHLGKDYGLVLGQPLTDVLLPRQEGHFLYLTGVTDPDASLLLAGAEAADLEFAGRDAPARTREVVFLRHGSPQFAQFVGLRHRPGAESAATLGVRLTRAAPRGGAGLARSLSKLLPADARLQLPGYRGPDHAPVREIRRALVETLAKLRPDIAVVDLHPFVARLRTIKDPYEIEALRRAVAATLAAFEEALPRIRPGSSEGAVDGALIAALRRRGLHPAYTFVVASGKNGAIPHYFRNEDPLRAGDLVVIDAGAEYDRYAADVTRTFPVSGTFTKRQRELYDAVLAAQRAALAEVKPGATMSLVHRAAKRVLADRGLGKYFIHGTSHHVGLDVHDPGAAKLQAGMVITVEPGVYLLEEDVGIRIEDVVLVTRTGAEVLSDGFPKDADAIERLLSAK